jgi:hypothetical protein
MKKKSKNSRNKALSGTKEQKEQEEKINRIFDDIEVAVQDITLQMKAFKPDYKMKTAFKRKSEDRNSEAEKNKKGASTSGGGGKEGKEKAKAREKREKNSERNKGNASETAGGSGKCYLINRRNDTLDKTCVHVIKDITEILKEAGEIVKITEMKSITVSFNPDDVPEEYKDDVSAYFRILSETPDKNK